MFLSIAMIVKNEQENLPRCLESIKDLYAELIVVDTGSIDQTIKIAKDYGAKVYQHPWEDNFAKHRNQSFGYASGKWIFQIDADEELVFHGNRASRILLEFLDRVRPDMNAIALRCDDIQKGKVTAHTQLARIFRNGQVKYKRRIHNEPMFKGPIGLFPHGKLNHYGYDLDDIEREKKAKRTIGLLKQSIEENPLDYDSMFYLAEAYATYAHKIPESIQWAEKYLANRKKIKGFNVSAFYLLITLYMKINNLRKCWEWLEIALKEVQDDVDINMALIRYGILTKNQNFIGAGARAFVTSYHNFKKNISERGGRFVFNYNKESLAEATFHLATTYLQHSSIELKNLYKLLPEIQIDVADRLRKGLKDWFDENETIFKHNDAMFQATETARTLYSITPRSNRPRLRTSFNP